MEGIRIEEQNDRKSEIVAEIMGQLKDWFGIEEVNKRLAVEAVGKPMWARSQSGRGWRRPKEDFFRRRPASVNKVNNSPSCDFYRKVGFVSLMDLPTLWNAENPCLVMVKYLKRDK